MSVDADVIIEVEDDGVTEMVSRIEHALSPASLQGFLLGKAARYLQQTTGMNFATESDREGRDWPQLSETTKAIRYFEVGASRTAHPINERTGDLRRWLTGSWGDAHMTGSGAELTWPSAGSTLNEQKLKVAQMGSRRGENPEYPQSETPRRPVIGANEVDMLSMLMLLGDHLAVMLGGSSNIGDFL